MGPTSHAKRQRACRTECTPLRNKGPITFCTSMGLMAGEPKSPGRARRPQCAQALIPCSTTCARKVSRDIAALTSNMQDARQETYMYVCMYVCMYVQCAST